MLDDKGKVLKPLIESVPSCARVCEMCACLCPNKKQQVGMIENRR